MSLPKFQEMHQPNPVEADVAHEYRAIEAEFDAAQDAAGRRAAIERWDALRRNLMTWEALVNLRFNQDTVSDEYKADRNYCDQLRPKLTELAVALKRKLLTSPHRDELVREFGPQAFALWEVDIASFDPAIADDLVREAELEAEYVELTASAKIPFQGETYNLSTITKFHESPDREVRHASQQARWGWFGDQQGTLDRIFDNLVKLRTQMARKLGYENFVGLAYKRMARVDYNQADVERFRAAVREQVVPLAVELRRQQAQRLEVAPLMFWDEPVFDPSGNPAPQGDHDWMLEQAKAMFDSLGPELSGFFEVMVDRDLMDLKTRPSKAGGGFCTAFPDYGVPYIFANFNGTKGDVEVFTHEMGHAFQCYMSRNLPLADYMWPTMDACEVHSMSLEYLTWPQMERFFGPAADRFRQIHLTSALFFLPYGVAVDHFQHLVYARPEATPDERRAMWQEMERTYLPWRNYGDLEVPGRGGLWPFQRHIYLSPFYYIDYTLAETCALQFWVRASRDFAGAMRDYVALCRRGGEASFQNLVRSAGLTSPFEAGCLTEVVTQARTALGV